jgi:hypothetical protein
MCETGSVNRQAQRHEKVLAFTSKVTALLSLAAVGLLLTRTTITTLPVGWIVILMAVIQIGLAYSPTRGSAIRGAVPVRSTDCRLFASQASSYRRRKLGRTAD